MGNKPPGGASSTDPQRRSGAGAPVLGGSGGGMGGGFAGARPTGTAGVGGGGGGMAGTGGMGTTTGVPAGENLARKNTGESIRQIINKGSVNTNYMVHTDVVLGRGHYAIVNLAVDRRSNKEVALKRIQISKSRTEALKAEIEVLLRVGHHPNIVSLYDIYITDTEVQLVMELLKGGELFDRMVDKGPYSELEASNHIGKIGHALKFLHNKGIVHRDLKPENLILVDKSDNAELKIADFGLSKMVDDIENSRMQTVCGTWAYAAPEVKTSAGANGGAAYNYKVDLWSTGVIMYVILAAYHPFDPDGDCSDAQLWSNICRGKFDFNDPAWDQISESAKDLIRHLIVVDPVKRYGIDELLAHPWVAHVGVSVPMTPITPMIDTNLKSFQKKKQKYGANTPMGSSVPAPMLAKPPAVKQPVAGAAGVPRQPVSVAAQSNQMEVDTDENLL